MKQIGFVLVSILTITELTARTFRRRPWPRWFPNDHRLGETRVDNYSGYVTSRTRKSSSIWRRKTSTRKP